MLKNTIEKMKHVALAAGAIRRAVKLEEHCGELVEHFDEMLTEFRKQTRGNPEHQQMESSLSIMVENLRITHVLLIEQRNLAGGVK